MPDFNAVTDLPLSRSRGRTTTGLIRSRAALLALAVATVTLAAPGWSTPADAAVARTAYTGNAYGTSAWVGSVAKSVKSAYLTFGCTTNGALRLSNTSAGVNLPHVVSTGNVATYASTYASPAQSRVVATTSGVRLLDGLVTATAVRAASQTLRTATGYDRTSTGTTLTNLVVAGIPVDASTPPNTRIELPGFGYVVVNQQVKWLQSLTVVGLHLYVTKVNALGVAVGTNVAVSHVMSGLSDPIVGVLGGYSYGSRANLGSTAVSGQSFTEYMPCLGTRGAVQHNTGAGVTLGTSIKTGTIDNTARGTVTGTSAAGETTSTVQSANLLNGLVKATVIKADANASTDGNTYKRNGIGSTFGSLTVAGHPEITRTVAANTKVTLNGVGTLYLRRVLTTTRSVTVRMIELVLTHPVNGLKAGTVINIAVANASAR